MQPETDIYPTLSIEHSLIDTDPALARGCSLHLTASHVVIGRANTSDLPVAHHELSRQHVQISARGERYYITDLDSTNGTVVNGQRLAPHTPQLLKDGDQIELAEVIRFRFGDPGVTMRRRPTLQPPSLRVDASDRSVHLAGRPPERLAANEFHLLALLLEQAGQVVTREQIVAAVWPDAHGVVSEAMIDNTVARLRRQLHGLGAGQVSLETIRGIGYRLREGAG